MSCPLIALMKRPVIFPVSVGEMWKCLFAKYVLRATVPEATNEFQDEHICSHLKVGFDRAVHGVQYIWGANSSTEYWGFLLVDTNNVFNKINLIGMLWAVHHLWPFGALFVFNF